MQEIDVLIEEGIASGFLSPAESEAVMEALLKKYTPENIHNRICQT